MTETSTLGFPLLPPVVELPQWRTGTRHYEGAQEGAHTARLTACGDLQPDTLLMLAVLSIKHISYTIKKISTYCNDNPFISYSVRTFRYWGNLIQTVGGGKQESMVEYYPSHKIGLLLYCVPKISGTL